MKTILANTEIHDPQYAPIDVHGRENERMTYHIEAILKPLFRFALGEIEGVRVERSSPALKEEISLRVGQEIGSLQRHPLSEIDRIALVRRSFKALGLDAYKIRSSCESLLRKVLNDRNLPSVNSVVDTANLIALTTLLPIGIYDKHWMIGDQIRFRRGLARERFVAIGQREIYVSGLCVVVDEEGPFGSPVFDSARTMIRPSTRDLLFIIYAPITIPVIELSQCLNDACERFVRFNGGSVVSQRIF